MKGLLSRAKDIRRKLGLSVPVQSAQEREAEMEGVSPEELEHINRRIEEVAAASRIEVNENTFQIAAAKRGWGLPLAVLAGSIAVGILGAVLMLLLFQQNESSIEESVQMQNSTEGRLLQLVKEEAAANLAAKEAEIADIQKQLTQIENQRDDLQANFDSRIASREAELRDTLEAELQAERERLQGQGMTSDEIERQIEQLRQEKESALAQALAQYRSNLQAERDKAEADLTKLQSEAAANLAAANDARAQLESEAKAREAELQAQLDAAQQANQAQLDEAGQRVAAAQQALEELNNQRQQEQALSEQLNGFYSQIRTQINNKNYGQAQNTITLLKNFINSDKFLAVDSLRQRRDTEGFLADALSQLITTTQRRNTENTSLLETASLVTEVQTIYGEAQNLSNSGKKEEALDRYREAINLIPEISRAYSELQDSETAAIQTESAQQADAAEEELRTSLAADYQKQLDELESRLNDQISRLQATIAQRDQTLAERNKTIDDQKNRISSLSSQVASLQSDLDDRNAEYASLQENMSALEGLRTELGDQADALLNQLASQKEDIDSLNSQVQDLQNGRTADQDRISELTTQLENARNALGGSGQDLADAKQRISALESQLSDSATSLEDANAQIGSLQTQLGDSTTTLAKLNDQLTKSKAELASLQQELADQKTATAAAANQSAQQSGGVDAGTIASYEERIAEQEKNISDLQSQLTRTRSQSDQYSSQINSLEEDISKLQEQNSQLDDQLNLATASRDRLTRETTRKIVDLENQVSEFGRIVDKYNSMVSSYEKYRSTEDNLTTVQGDSNTRDAQLAGKTALDSFLSDPQVQEAFPGLLERIRSYDQAFQSAGEENIAFEMADEIYTIYSYPGTAARLDYIDKQVAQTDDDAMKEFYNNIRLIILGNS